MVVVVAVVVVVVIVVLVVVEVLKKTRTTLFSGIEEQSSLIPISISYPEVGCYHK